MPKGLIRVCPICDGYEAIDRHIAVLGHGPEAWEEALFIRTYSPHVTLLTLDRPMLLTVNERAKLDAAGVAVEDEPVSEIVVMNGQSTQVILRSGQTLAFTRKDRSFAGIGIDDGRPAGDDVIMRMRS